MLSIFPTRRRHAPADRLALALAFAASSNRVAHASVLALSRDCSASGNSLKCYLLEFLNVLYAAATLLGLVLLGVVVLAVRIYRKMKKADTTEL